MSDNGDVKMTAGCLPRISVLPQRDIGTFAPGFVYLPPEVLQGHIYIASADMYAFAIFTLEIKLLKFEAFSDFRKCSIKEFLKISPKSYLEESVRGLALSQAVIKKLLLCLDNNMNLRPDASNLGAEFKGKTFKKSTMTPRSIFSRAFSSKRK